MGMRESLMTNFENKTLEYKNKQFYIVKQFDYKGRTYLYGVEKETINSEEYETYFLYRVKDDLFNHISDKNEQLELLEVVSGLFMSDIIKKNLKNQIKKFKKIK